MPSHNQIKDFVERKDADNAALRVQQSRTIVADGIRARSTLEHPGWAMFEEKVQALLVAAQAAVAAQRHAYLHAAKEESANLARRAAFLAEGAEGAFMQVLAILPKMVEDGERARVSA